MKIDVTQRLTLLWSVLFLVALAVFAAFAAAFVDRAAQVALDQRLLAQVALAAGSIDQGRARLDADVPRPQLPGFALAVYKNGRPVQVAGAAPPPGVLRDAAARPLGVPVTISSPAPYRVVVESVSDAPSLRIAAFASEEPVREESSRLRRTFVVVGGPLAIAAILAGWFLARRALAPIDRLTRTAAEVARTGRFSARFTVQTRDELGRLGATFNAMLESLEATYERERSFIGDVSHELRQPLTAITGEAELALRRPREPVSDRETLDRIEERATSLRSLIDDLLVLARADARALGTGTGEVSESLAEACNAVRPFYPDVTLAVQVREETLTVAISAPLLVRLFTNVARNAMQAARSGVTATVTREARDAVVTVDDDGPGIPEAARGQLFRRFQRLPRDAHYPGTGLGLAISAAIVAVANGSIAVEASPGGGARFTIRLPLLA
ncbi:MAG: sensor histidine kinase [Candidatus Eremiobacteraeota bacterium]|nr:sensor histidine kinase [Candidatus Eremiobacteraeota bacterium]